MSVPDWPHGGHDVYSFLNFCTSVCLQPSSREKQQHRQSSRERRHGCPRPRLRHPLPYGGTDCCCAAWQTTTPLQRCSARLLTGGGPAKQAHARTHTLASTHTHSHMTHELSCHPKPSKDLCWSVWKFGVGFPCVADLRYSSGTA